MSEENVRIRRFMTKRTVYKRMLVFEGLSAVFAIMHTDRVSFADLSSETTVFPFFLYLLYSVARVNPGVATFMLNTARRISKSWRVRRIARMVTKSCCSKSGGNMKALKRVFSLQIKSVTILRALLLLCASAGASSIWTIALFQQMTLGSDWYVSVIGLAIALILTGVLFLALQSIVDNSPLVTLRCVVWLWH